MIVWTLAAGVELRFVVTSLYAIITDTAASSNMMRSAALVRGPSALTIIYLDNAA